MTLMLGAAAGADIFGHMGISGADQAASLDILVMQNEIILYVESVMRDLDFSDDAFALDEIADAGPGGHFIDRMHTATHFRKELWMPALLDRDYYEAWRTGGGVDMEERCGHRVKELLDTHQPEPMDAALSSTIDGIVAAARKELTRP